MTSDAAVPHDLKLAGDVVSAAKAVERIGEPILVKAARHQHCRGDRERRRHEQRHAESDRDHDNRTADESDKRAGDREHPRGPAEFRAGAGDRLSLGILHAGTGGDFRRMLANTDDLTAACRTIALSEPATVDCGWVEYQTEDGGSRGRHFLNIASLGMGGLVDRFVNESKHRLRGGPAYALATLRANSVYRPAEVELEVDSEPVGTFTISNICVCNGRWAGGGMMFAPDARLSDGLLDVVVLEAASTLRSLPMMRGLYKGTHTRSALVHVFQGQRVRVTPRRHTAYMDIDGEAPGIAPASFQVRANALRVHGVRKEFL